jgi:hypothetical protein
MGQIRPSALTYSSRSFSFLSMIHHEKIVPTISQTIPLLASRLPPSASVDSEAQGAATRCLDPPSGRRQPRAPACPSIAQHPEVKLRGQTLLAGSANGERAIQSLLASTSNAFIMASLTLSIFFVTSLFQKRTWSPSLWDHFIAKRLQKFRSLFVIRFLLQVLTSIQLDDAPGFRTTHRPGGRCQGKSGI